MIKYRCRECGRAIDCLDAGLTVTYPLCPRCLYEAIRTRSPAAVRALQPIRKESDNGTNDMGSGSDPNHPDRC
jgi:hypothetical protein